MVVSIDFKAKALFPLTYQDTIGFTDAETSPELRPDLDKFLSTWLTNLKHQGHQLAIIKQEKDEVAQEIKAKPKETPVAVAKVSNMTEEEEAKVVPFPKLNDKATPKQVAKNAPASEPVAVQLSLFPEMAI